MLSTDLSTLKLSDYPDAIANLEIQALKRTQDVRMLKETLLAITFDVDQVIFEETNQKLLKNEDQRKIRKAELLTSNPDYALVQANLQQAQDEATELEIEINRLRSKFSLLKLEQRKEIAVMELRAVSTAA